MKIEHLGSQWGGVNLCPDLIAKGGSVVSAGLGPDVSLDVALISRFDCSVYGIDPTAAARKAVDLAVQVNGYRKGQFNLMPYALSDTTGDTVYLGGPAKTMYSRVGEKAETMAIMEVLSDIKELTLLKLDIEGAEYPVMRSVLSEGVTLQRLRPPQICIGFHHWLNGPTDRYPGKQVNHPFTGWDTLEIIRRLRRVGYKFVMYSNDDPGRVVQEALFVWDAICPGMPDKLAEVEDRLKG